MKYSIPLKLYRYRFLSLYVLWGFLALIVELLLTRAMVSFGLPYLVGNFLGLVVGVTFAFVMNAMFNFRIVRSKWLRALVYFTLISGISLSFQFLIRGALLKAGISMELSRFLIAGAFFLVAYWFHRRFSFADYKQVGVAIYADGVEDIEKIHQRIGDICDFIHVDIVDETFLPDCAQTKAYRTEVIKAYWRLKPIEVHIMSRRPSEWLGDILPFVDTVYVHLSIDESHRDLIDRIRRGGCHPGLALSVGDDFEEALRLIDQVDRLLLLAIRKPGMSGQSFDYSTLERIDQLDRIHQRSNFRVCVDGGVNTETVRLLKVESVVSGSFVLKDSNPRRRIMELQTSGYYQNQGQPVLDKSRIRQSVLRAVRSVGAVRSLTFVGSFVASPSIKVVSDIDIVVVVDRLDESVFHRLVAAVGRIDARQCSLAGYAVKVNSTFGPLKFDDEKTIVFHLMIYDLAGHRIHVQQSPFTCNDWEKQDAVLGTCLKDLYGSSPLQFTDLHSSRRSLQSYSRDLDAGSISFREYTFGQAGPVEVCRSSPIDERHRKEFACHILRNTALNFLKILRQENLELESNALAEALEAVTVDFLPHARFYRELHNWKKYGHNEPTEIRERLDLALAAFATWIETNVNGAPLVYFIRHAKTPLNDGTFLGSGRDPEIIPIEGSPVWGQPPTRVFVSSLRRTAETARALGCSEYLVDRRLDEINYGVAEGLSFQAFRAAHPDVARAWGRHEDPRFPEGENQGDVKSRLDGFIAERLLLESAACTLVFTHNVVLRVLLGSAMRIPLHQWHLLQPGHGEAFAFRVVCGILVPQWTDMQRTRLRDAIHGVDGKA